ncbi:pimeloyl-ACP methyl ester carboxylesterase [Flavobacterium sp. CG_9.10]|uniref:alpha/beta fold hydrolase n=1 Tax=Flavobacterium sp. CG_9.10 TaxID=2787729 RepID=UPI0018C97EFC|nr:alpha/beta hydrolase [Flavobacterium sp. CG_9.10]MBG6111926.1 pimeloyl-ACP methyl ester carboxylesterase [Flavobacterium sp. CG_9.10]
MKTALELNEMILGITNNIRENHPELLKYLNEMPVTVPCEENPEITVKILKTYYDSVAILLEEYQVNSTKNTLTNKFQNLPITKIKTMKLDNSFQNLLTEVNNIKISYNDVGEGNIPIIFLHGFPFDKSMWKGQLDSLKSSNRVIAIDIRGFGKSTDEKTTLSIDLFCDDLIAFMNKLNIEKAILCGLSMGGYICLNALKRFPERFAAMILCDTQCIADTAEVKENRYKTIEQINLNGAAEFNEKFIKSVFHPDSLADKVETVENLRNIVFANSKKIITNGLSALAQRSETCSILHTIHIPTLIICGREDKVTPLVQSEFMHKNIEESIFKIIDNAGHVSNLEHAEEFNKRLLDFLNSIDSNAN